MNTDKEGDTKRNRDLYIDNLKLFVIALVVMQHLSVTYSGMGSWYYVEPGNSSLAIKVVFLFYNSFNQSYFMGLMFWLAGYYVPGSYDRKGFAWFCRERLFRLGAPTLLYMLLLHPLIMYALGAAGLRKKLDFLPYYRDYVVNLKFLSGSGPMWFALALLVFCLAYSLVRRAVSWHGLNFSWPLTSRHLIGLSGLIAVMAFLIRLVQPVGTAIMNMQICYFSQYIILFVVGMACYRNQWLQRMDYRFGLKWLRGVLVLGPVLWISLVVGGGALRSRSTALYNGGLHWQTAAYALLESYIAVAMSVGLIVLFREKCNRQGRVVKILSDNAFAVYVFHAPMIIAMAVAFRPLIWPPILKFLGLGIVALPVCFAVASLFLRRIPLLNRVI